MLLYKNIVKEENKLLREKSENVLIPLSDEDYSLLTDMNSYLVEGYKLGPDETNEDIRPGVGIAAPQAGENKRMFCIIAYDEKEKLHEYNVLNPKIISTSEELCFLQTGEGCLSVDRCVEGYVHRPKRIKARVTLYDFENDTYTNTVLKLEGYIAIVFQHEYDHLEGILFVDKINKANPFFIPENSKPIVFKTDDNKN